MHEKALKAVVRRLHLLRKKRVIEDFALIGGFAVARWGVPRATADIDFAFKPGGVDLGLLATQLRGKLRQGSPTDPLIAAITFNEQTIPVQLLQFPPAWERVVFEEVVEDRFGRERLRTVSWKALVLLKLYGGSALDLEDARRVVGQVRPSSKDVAELISRANRLRVSKRLEKVLKG